MGAAPQDSGSNQSDAAKPGKEPSYELSQIVTAIQKANPTPDHGPGCQDRKDNRESDLCAQWKAADAAAESATWTFGGFIVSLISALIGLGTLAAACFAAWYAKRAADAAISQSRAWVSFGINCKLRKTFSVDVVEKEDGTKRILFPVKWQNVGHSPAHHL